VGPGREDLLALLVALAQEPSGLLDLRLSLLQALANRAKTTAATLDHLGGVAMDAPLLRGNGFETIDGFITLGGEAGDGLGGLVTLTLEAFATPADLLEIAPGLRQFVADFLERAISLLGASGGLLGGDAECASLFRCRCKTLAELRNFRLETRDLRGVPHASSVEGGLEFGDAGLELLDARPVLIEFGCGSLGASTGFLEVAAERGHVAGLPLELR
jgi:hypothetical protein